MIKKEFETELAFEGQPHEIAVQIFEKIAAPVSVEMFNHDPEMAHTFMCHMLWLSMGAYADLFQSNGTSEKGIQNLTEQFLKALREHPHDLKS